jgi:hypothetical protein
MTWHAALQSPEHVIAVGQRLADQGVRRFAVQIARSAQMLNASIGAGYLSLDETQNVSNNLAPLFETFDIRE